MKRPTPLALVREHMQTRLETKTAECERLLLFAAAMHHHCQHSFKIKEGHHPCGLVYLLENTCYELLRLRINSEAEDDTFEKLVEALPSGWRSAMLEENIRLTAELAALTSNPTKGDSDE